MGDFNLGFVSGLSGAGRGISSRRALELAEEMRRIASEEKLERDLEFFRRKSAIESEVLQDRTFIQDKRDLSQTLPAAAVAGVISGEQQRRIQENLDVFSPDEVKGLVSELKAGMAGVEAKSAGQLALAQVGATERRGALEEDFKRSQITANLALAQRRLEPKQKLQWRKIGDRQVLFDMDTGQALSSVSDVKGNVAREKFVAEQGSLAREVAIQKELNDQYLKSPQAQPSKLKEALTLGFAEAELPAVMPFNFRADNKAAVASVLADEEAFQRVMQADLDARAMATVEWNERRGIESETEAFALPGETRSSVDVAFDVDSTVGDEQAPEEIARFFTGEDGEAFREEVRKMREQGLDWDEIMQILIEIHIQASGQ